MRLERSFSIEQFQSNTTLKNQKFQHNHMVFLYVFFMYLRYLVTFAESTKQMSVVHIRSRLQNGVKIIQRECPSLVEFFTV